MSAVSRRVPPVPVASYTSNDHAFLHRKASYPNGHASPLLTRPPGPRRSTPASPPPSPTAFASSPPQTISAGPSPPRSVWHYQNHEDSMQEANPAPRRSLLATVVLALIGCLLLAVSVRLGWDRWRPMEAVLPTATPTPVPRPIEPPLSAAEDASTDDDLGQRQLQELAEKLRLTRVKVTLEPATPDPAAVPRWVNQAGSQGLTTGTRAAAKSETFRVTTAKS